MPTKRDIIRFAMEELGLGAYAYQVQPEDLQSARFRLNAIMGEFDATGGHSSWPIGEDLDQETNLSHAYLEAAITNLACRIAPSFGKIPSAETKIAAHQGKNLMMRRNLEVPTRKRDAMIAPMGAGQKRTYRANIADPDTVITPDERQD